MASTAEAPAQTHIIPPIFTNYTVDKPRIGLWGLSFADIFHLKHYIRENPGAADPHDLLEPTDTFRNFLKADPIIDDGARRWSPSRVLGRGGFGLVGLWQLKDENGEVQDEMVVKEWNYGDHLEVSGKRGLAKEAVIQYQTNQRGRALAPILRHLKFVQDPGGDETNHKWRTYSEFCPNGDLDRLATRYRAWGKYLPETFLWHHFHSLARVAREMGKSPRINYENMRQWPAGWHLLHFDLKSPNVLIGKRPRPAATGEVSTAETGGTSTTETEEASPAETEESSTAETGETSTTETEESSTADGTPPPAKRSRLNEEGDDAKVAALDNFPVIKVHDFGLADFTSSTHPDNPNRLFWLGTPGYKPPEQRHYAIESPRNVNYPRRPLKPAATARNVVVNPYRPRLYTSGPRAGKHVPMYRVRNYDETQFPNTDARSDHYAWQGVGDRSASEAGLKFDEKFNAWGVGKIMYDLVTHARWSHLDRILDLLDETEAEIDGAGWEEANSRLAEDKLGDDDLVVEDDGNAADDFLTRAEQAAEDEPREDYQDSVKESLRMNEFYHKDLVNLVRQCLNVRKSRRPAPSELFRLTRRGLAHSRERAAADDDALSQAVFYQDNEINQLPPGAHPFNYSPGDFDDLVRAKYWDVSWPRLRPPKTYLELAWRLEAADWRPEFPYRGREVLRDGLVYPRLVPTRQEYMGMTSRQLGEEIDFRYGNPDAIPRLKAERVDQLMAMDEAGNYGNGLLVRRISRPPALGAKRRNPGRAARR